MKISIKINGITAKEYIQMGFYNTNAFAGNLNEFIEISNEINVNSAVVQKISLTYFETYKSILPLQIIKPDNIRHIINYE